MVVISLTVVLVLTVITCEGGPTGHAAKRKEADIGSTPVSHNNSASMAPQSTFNGKAPMSPPLVPVDDIMMDYWKCLISGGNCNHWQAQSRGESEQTSQHGLLLNPRQLSKSAKPKRRLSESLRSSSSSAEQNVQKTPELQLKKKNTAVIHTRRTTIARESKPSISDFITSLDLDLIGVDMTKLVGQTSVGTNADVSSQIGNAEAAATTPTPFKGKEQANEETEPLTAQDAKRRRVRETQRKWLSSMDEERKDRYKQRKARNQKAAYYRMDSNKKKARMNYLVQRQYWRRMLARQEGAIQENQQASQ